MEEFFKKENEKKKKSLRKIEPINANSSRSEVYWSCAEAW